MKTQLQGRVTVRIIKKDGTKKIITHNNVSQEFALALATVLLTGNTGTGYVSGYSSPNQVVIVLLNNGAVVATILTNITKFKDVIQNYTETTTVTFVGSDATPTQYTFNQLELYTVVGNTLFLKVADVSIQSVTKERDDIVQVTWTEEIISGNIIGTGTACAQCTGTCNTSLLKQYNTPASIVNFIWALLIVPQLPQVAQQSNAPILYYVKLYFNTTITPVIKGVTQILLTDQCLNVLAQVNVEEAIVSYNASNDKAIATLSVITSIPSGTYYVIPIFTFQSASIVNAILGILTLQYTSQTGAVTVVVEIPYGEPTLQQLTVNS